MGEIEGAVDVHRRAREPVARELPPAVRAERHRRADVSARRVREPLFVPDCADPAALAAFYGKALGWEVTYSDDDTVQLGGPVGLGFQRVAGYRGPGWPDDAKHAHLDFKVGDLESAVEEFVALGATKPDFQPGGTDWG